MNIVHQPPQQDADPQHQTWQHWEHYGHQEVNEEGDEGPADEDDGGDDDDDHVTDQPRQSQSGSGGAGANVEETREDEVDHGEDDEDAVDQSGVVWHPTEHRNDFSSRLQHTERGNIKISISWEFLFSLAPALLAPTLSQMTVNGS